MQVIDIIKNLYLDLKKYDISYVYFTKFNGSYAFRFNKKIFDTNQTFYVNFSEVNNKSKKDVLNIILNKLPYNKIVNRDIISTPNTKKSKIIKKQTDNINNKKKIIRKLLIEKGILTNN